jgi:hypothetical protein
MDTAVLREKDKDGQLTKEVTTQTPTDYGVAAAEYVLQVIQNNTASDADDKLDLGFLGLESGYERSCGRGDHGISDVLYAGQLGD